MKRPVLATIALLSAVARSAAAAEFAPSWDLEGAWDSNVLHAPSNPESSPSIRTGPDIRFRQLQGDVRYDVDYELRYEAYTQISGINAFDHILNGTGSWHIGPTTDFSMSDSFGYLQNLTAITQFQPGLVGTLIPARERVIYNSGLASINEQLSPLWQLTGRLSNAYYNYQSPLQTDTLSMSGSLDATRAFSPRTSAGLGTSLTRQQFAAFQGIPAQGTTFLQAYGLARHSFTRTLTLSAQLGPAYSIPDSLPSVASIDSPSSLGIDPTTCRQQSGGQAFVPAGQQLSDCQTAFFLDSAGQPAHPINFATGQPVPGFNVAINRGPTVTLPLVRANPVSGEINYFGSLALDEAWSPHWNTSLSYTRQASTASGVATSTVLDSLSGVVRWTPTRDWTVTLTGLYAKQTSLSTAAQEFVLAPETVATQPVLLSNGQILFKAPAGVGIYVQTPTALVAVPPSNALYFPTPASATFGRVVEIRTTNSGKSAFELDSYTADLHAERRVTKRLFVTGGVTYWHQTTSGSFFVPTTSTAFRVDIGVTWQLEPIPL